MTLEQAEKVHSLIKELNQLKRCKDVFNVEMGYTIKFDEPKKAFDVKLPPYLVLEFGKEQIFGQLDKRIKEIENEIELM